MVSIRLVGKRANWIIGILRSKWHAFIHPIRSFIEASNSSVRSEQQDDGERRPKRDETKTAGGPWSQTTPEFSANDPKASLGRQGFCALVSVASP
jgi:hypothetical protein